ncbi:NRPS-like enzyme [Penicillium capsulatum]|uniref:NRPS-like enzyme n=1 Tax=Penicillium capsulatum TaxID=69766 RepID=A0A9W9HR36_9EURO|nr:NRPS-like enzyme [Penicillium capsulatum]KAJ6106043.1 NRPS-like enzyme [Penicillium capsulatum]
MTSPNHRLLPAILDEAARTSPEEEWARFPASEITYEAGFRVVTNRDAANAVNRVAWMLEEKLGRSSNFETIAYIGPTDIRYYIVVLAAIKVGYKAFLPSPRNSVVAHVDLLSRLDCTNLITTSPEPPCVSQIQESYPMHQTCLASVINLLDGPAVPDYSYDKSYVDAQKDPIFVLHTSGSTGIPKPLVYTNEFATRLSNAMDLRAPDGYVSLNDKFRSGRFLTILPAFHIAGIGFGLITASFSRSTPILPLPGKPPTTEGFLEAVAHTDADWAFILPVIIDDLSRDPAALAMVASKLQYLCFTGGSLPQAAGETVASRIPIHQCMGSSENAALPLIQMVDDQAKDDWRYFQVHPRANVEFRHRFENIHELILVKDQTLEEHQPVFLHFPGLAEYETRDLFSPHPTTPARWRHRGRMDDIVVFLNGEKTNPISFEQEVGCHPEVRSALVAGDQRFEACLLVELMNPGPHSPEEQTQILERIWPAVKAANNKCPAHARVSKTRILFTSPDKPMMRAGKGTVQRKGTLNAYSQLIDDLYARSDQQSFALNAGSLDLSDPIAITAAIRKLVLDITDWPDVKDADDFFGLGMDSLQVLHLSRELKHIMSPDNAAPATIYDNPSVELLVGAILRFHGRNPTSRVGEYGREELMASILQKYEVDIKQIADNRDTIPTDTSPSTSDVIMLTGSTGAVGSFILHELRQNRAVSHIYCLNRGENSHSIQENRNAARGLPENFSSEQVTFLTVDLSKPDLGLEKDVYKKMLSSVTQIIHNAWPVDFNQRLRSFRPSLDGVVNLISFAAHAKLSPSLFFLSSISAVAAYHQIPGAESHIPETVIQSFSCPAHMGYGESKYLAERILDLAAATLGVKTGVARVGQVAGTAKNSRGWNRNEWFPSLVVSSRALRALPLSLGAFEDASLSGGMMDSVDWVPIDQLVSVLIELSSSLSSKPAHKGARVFNLVNPNPREWKTVAPFVARTLQTTLNMGDDGEGKGPDIHLVGYSEWLQRLRSTAATLEKEGKEQALDSIPASKLLEFFQDSLILKDSDQTPRPMSLKLALEESPSLRSLKAIQDEWILGWLQGWIS